MKRLLAVFVLWPSLAIAGNWADQTDFAEFSESKAICRQFRSVPLPDPQRPDRRAQGGLPGCGSEALYYGIGVPADPGKAFACAMLEANGDHFSGDMMLLTMYANGKGVARDLDKAIALACVLGWAPAEFDARVRHLFSLRAGTGPAEEFSWCDDITSGYEMGYCAAHFQRIAEGKRKPRWDAVRAKWPSGEAARTLAELLAAGRTFAHGHGTEIDQSGTARGAMITDAREEVETQFLTDLEDLAAGGAAIRSAAADGGADAELNQVYRRVMAHDFGTLAGSPTQGGIRAAQREWLKYRDKWVAFTKSAAPAVPSQAIVNRLTRQRIKHLKELIGEGE